MLRVERLAVASKKAVDLPGPSRRLRFRHWSDADLVLAMRVWGDPKVTALIDTRGPLSEAQVQEKLDTELERQEIHGVSYWPMFEIEVQTFVGCCGLRPSKEEPLVLEMGFQICSSEWGKGYATESARHVLAFAFDALEVSALFAGHNPANDASRHLLKKLGFAFTREEFYEPTGLQHPSYLLTRRSYFGQPIS